MIYSAANIEIAALDKPIIFVKMTEEY